MAKADKNDPVYIAARAEFVRQETELMMQRLYKSYAESVEEETSAFYEAQDKAYQKMLNRKETL
jgi:hypothetical protein